MIIDDSYETFVSHRINNTNQTAFKQLTSLSLSLSPKGNISNIDLPSPFPPS